MSFSRAEVFALIHRAQHASIAAPCQVGSYRSHPAAARLAGNYDAELTVLREKLLVEKCEIFRDALSGGAAGYRFVGNEETGDGEFILVFRDLDGPLAIRYGEYLANETFLSATQQMLHE